MGEKAAVAVRRETRRPGVGPNGLSSDEATRLLAEVGPNEIPVGWLPEGVTVEQVAAGLRPLLDKPVEFVLPTHGEPADRAALERALA
ncbi:MAG TPA: cation-transporting P-type ATPase [Solirubrobacteraceae bacterium]|nr:cation-transporting P-type ATPase [Solirubrobacteraceae bacterium]